MGSPIEDAEMHLTGPAAAASSATSRSTKDGNHRPSSSPPRALARAAGVSLSNRRQPALGAAARLPPRGARRSRSVSARRANAWQRRASSQRASRGNRGSGAERAAAKGSTTSCEAAGSETRSTFTTAVIGAGSPSASPSAATTRAADTSRTRRTSFANSLYQRPLLEMHRRDCTSNSSCLTFATREASSLPRPGMRMTAWCKASTQHHATV
mmetsp:Transcript_38209/g.109713  ORF Transcript_38209/g.109713 Transcript_38209/m.109713 type:complete len:212 (-) Transcript_38209:1534-2169(-)